MPTITPTVLVIDDETSLTQSLEALMQRLARDRTHPQVITIVVERSDEVHRREAELAELRARYASLSDREREVMSLVIAGLLNKQVGGRLGISVITVKAHRGKVMRKMAADSLPALVGMAIRLGLSTEAVRHFDFRPYQRSMAPSRQFTRLAAV